MDYWFDMDKKEESHIPLHQLDTHQDTIRRMNPHL